jgi:hypothetical protein
MDIDGNVVESADKAYGQPCTIRITHPELCFVADEVGSNISQTGDGNIGGRKLVCATGCVPQQKVGNKNKHFTVMGLTALTGEPVMCIVIIEGMQRQVEIELGIDLDVQTDVGSLNDMDYVKRNTGKGKRFPGGPTCHFKGKDILCFMRFQEKGGMTGEILLDIFKTLDFHKLFDNDRKNGRRPFFLLDGHGSRFHLPFIKYINTEETRHGVSIGVPYGTSYWQVGDSSEQNGYNQGKGTNSVQA